MGEKSRTILVSVSEARAAIKRRLMDDWVIILGNGDAIHHLECTVYPPGTPNNADFELVGFMPHTVYLAKKTDGLRQLCRISDFDNLAGIIFHAPMDSTGVVGRVGWLAESITYDTTHGDKAAATDHLISQLTHQWDNPHEPEDQGDNNG